MKDLNLLKYGIDSMVRAAESTYSEGKNMPIVVQINVVKDSKNTAIITPIDSDVLFTNRFNFVKVLGEVFAELQKLGEIERVGGIAFISEAWSAQVSKDEYESPNYEHVLPSKHKDKTEVLTAFGVTANNEHYIVAKQIVRMNIKGKDFVSLSDVKMEDIGGSECALLDPFFKAYNEKLLDKTEPNEDQKEILEQIKNQLIIK